VTPFPFTAAAPGPWLTYPTPDFGESVCLPHTRIPDTDPAWSEGRIRTGRNIPFEPNAPNEIAAHRTM